MTDDLKWMNGLCSPQLHDYLEHPFSFEGHAVATNRHAMLFIKDAGAALPVADTRAAHVIRKHYYSSLNWAIPVPSKKQSFAAFRKWLGKDIPATAFKYDPAIVFGVLVDRDLVRQYIEHLSGKQFSVQAVEAGGYKKEMLVMEGDGWRLLVMGCHPSQKKYPHYPEAARRKRK